MPGQRDYGFIISLDAQGSSKMPDPDRPAMRDQIYRVVESAFTAARLRDARLFLEDRGDGVLAVFAPRAAERIAGEWVAYVHHGLRTVNQDPERPLRLRAGLSVGPVTPDEHGFSGAAVDLACRIGNCSEAKAVLAASPEALLLVAVTDQVHHDVIRHGGRWIEPDHYRQFDVSLQEGPQRAWFMVPGLKQPPLPGRDETARSGDSAKPSQEGDGERRHGASAFQFGTVTHNGSGHVIQGEIGDITINRRPGGGA